MAQVESRQAISEEYVQQCLDAFMFLALSSHVCHMELRYEIACIIGWVAPGIFP